LLTVITHVTAFSSALSKSLVEGKHTAAAEGVPRAAEGSMQSIVVLGDKGAEELEVLEVGGVSAGGEPITVGGALALGGR
jgi:hypothetical protein